MGVVVHLGQAQMGHYYSFIDTKADTPNAAQSRGANRWMEFNDSVVKEFDPHNLEEECFGSNADVDVYDTYYDQENSRSAYILVYERKLKSDITLQFSSREECERTLSKTRIPVQPSQVMEEVAEATLPAGKQQSADCGHADQIVLQSSNQPIKDTQQLTVKVKIPYYDIKGYQDPKLFQEVWEDNQKFYFQKYVSDEQFISFLGSFLQLIEIPAATAGQLKLTEQQTAFLKMMLELLKQLLFDVFLKYPFNQVTAAPPRPHCSQRPAFAGR